MRLSVIVFIVVILPLKQECTAQSKISSLKCLLLNSQTNKPIAYAHIYNESQRNGAISDSSGLFIMNSCPGDTIVFIALGYYGDYYTTNNYDFDSVLIFRLVPRSYDIEEVSVRFPISYQHFKQELLKIDTDKDRPMPEMPQFNKYKTPFLLDTNIVLSADFLINHPISGLYYRFSKEEKSKRKVWYAQKQELFQSEVDEKFNREIVSKITGFQDDELSQFIGYCNFSFNYLFETSSYEIILAIERKYKEYLICCYQKTKDNNRN